MFLLLFFLFLIPSNAFSFDITVKTLNEGKPIASAIIKIWNKNAVIRHDKPDFVYKSGINGFATIDLNGGEYYIFAEKTEKDIYYFGFFGQNPVSITHKDELSINLVKYPITFVSNKKESGITGTVYYDGKPVSNVNVYAYLDLTSELKGPSFLNTITDENGKFSLDLEQGSYYLVFRKKSIETFGPPSPGDYISIFPQFPLELSDTGYDIKVSLLKIPDKMKSNLKDKNFLIKGKVFSNDKKPKKGVYVVLYEDYTLLGKPDYVSHQTNEKGEFSIYVKKAGSYFVVLRKSLGDTPMLGEDVSSITEIKVGEDKAVTEIVINANN